MASRTRGSGGMGVGAWLALLAVALMAAYALCAPWLASGDPLDSDFSRGGLAPSWAAWFGTDAAGHDLFVRVALALRVSLLIALVTALSSAVVGTLAGIAAGMLGGWTDRIVMRCADTLCALPHLLVGVLIVALFRGSVLAIICSLVLTHWISIARVVRAQTIGLRHADYVEAAWLAGMSRMHILVYHFVPASLGQALVGVTLLVPHTIWHESTLSFLGLGLPAHMASLGTLMSDAQGALLLGQWWTLVFPCLLLVLVTLAVAVLGAAAKRRFTGAMA